MRSWAIFLLTFVAVLLVLPNAASADVGTDTNSGSYDGSVRTTLSSSRDMTQYIGTNLSGAVTGIEMVVNRTSVFSGGIDWEIVSISGSDYATWVVSAPDLDTYGSFTSHDSGNESVSQNSIQTQVDTVNGFIADPTRHYFVRGSRSSSASILWYGLGTDTYTEGFCIYHPDVSWPSGTNDTIPCPNQGGGGSDNFDLAVKLTGDVSVQPQDTSNRLVGQEPFELIGGAFGSSISLVSTTTATTTVNFKAEYFLNSSNPIPNVGIPDEIRLSLIRIDTATSSGSQTVIFDNLSTDTLSDVEQEVVLAPNASYNVQWVFYNSATDQFGYATPIGRLSTLTNPIEGDEDVGNFFGNLYNSIRYKPPFGYVVVTLEQINGIATTSTSTLSIATATPIMDNIINPLKTGVAGILWALFAFAYFKRLADLDI